MGEGYWGVEPVSEGFKGLVSCEERVPEWFSGKVQAKPL